MFLMIGAALGQLHKKMGGGTAPGRGYLITELCPTQWNHPWALGGSQDRPEATLRGPFCPYNMGKGEGQSSIMSPSSRELGWRWEWRPGGG